MNVQLLYPSPELAGADVLLSDRPSWQDSRLRRTTAILAGQVLAGLAFG